MIRIKRQNSNNKNVTFEKDDVLNRKTFGESLYNLIENSGNESLVISINSNWWEWKTHFLHMWKNYVTSEKEDKVIYFDAFKNDFIDDPFLALLWEIMKSYNEEKEIFDKVKEKWWNILKSIIPLSWKVAARLALWWDLKSVDDELEKLVDWELVNFVWNTLEQYTKKEDEISIFKETLEEIIKENGKIIFIIDELDRCRPDFAMRLLERIKHFFDIEWLYFVLAINKDELEKYIKKIYWDIDTNKYLHKFIDIETILQKKLVRSNTEEHYKIFIEKSLNDYSDTFSEHEDQTKRLVIRLFIKLAKPLELSLRDIEKITNYLALFYKSLPNKSLNLPMTTMFLIFIKLFDSNLYSKLRKGKAMKSEIIKKLRLDEHQWSLYEERLNDELAFIFDENIEEKILEKYNWINRYGFYDPNEYESRKEILQRHFQLLESFDIK